MPYPNYIGSHRRLWTRKYVLKQLAAAAAEIRGPLPCSWRVYRVLRKGRLDWPSSGRVLGYFHSMARGWLAAGASPGWVWLGNIDWTAEEEAYLLEHAGSMTLAAIGKKLRRSWPSCKWRLHVLGTNARANQGYLSAAELAKLYGCSVRRICSALAGGRIKGWFDRRRHRWQVDTMDITMDALAILNAPKATHKNRPPDVGDYERRYNLKRILVDGKIKRVLRA